MQDTTEMLEFLLQGELAALETYDKALGRFDHGLESERLQAMKADHEYAAHAIRNLLARCSDHPMVESSGPWGAFACTAEAIAIAIGDRSTLETLKLGEEHGCDLYRTALEEPQLSAEARQLIRTRLLPRCYRHRQALETMLTA